MVQGGLLPGIIHTIAVRITCCPGLRGYYRYFLIVPEDTITLYPHNSLTEREPGQGRVFIIRGMDMRFSHISLIAVMLVVIAVALAGCSGSSPAAPSSSGTQTTGTAAGAASGGSSVPAAGSVVSGANLFGNANYKWYEYKMTSKDMSSNTKFEVSQDTYKGKAVKHTKMTSTMTTPMAATTIYDIYMDASGVSMGGHMKMISNGQTIMDQDIPAGDPSKTPKDPTADPTVQYTFVGVEPVNVPAGTYPAAMKYTANIQGMTSTYWTAPGVPTFVKMVMKSTDGDITEELVGWG